MPTVIMLALTPFITALIGWFTNWVAIQMLFHPRKPKLILFWKWQGLIPRRQAQLAKEAAEIIEREILQQHQILNVIKKIDLKPYLKETAKHLVWERLAPRLKAIPLLGGFVSNSVLENLEQLAAEEIENEAIPLMEKVALNFESSFDLQQVIENNIASFDLDRLEAIVKQVANREFQTIERLGAVLGFIIGLVQVALFCVTGVVDF